jgi:hypothetical protein
MWKPDRGLISAERTRDNFPVAARAYPRLATRSNLRAGFAGSELP